MSSFYLKLRTELKFSVSVRKVIYRDYMPNTALFCLLKEMKV
jgi:hypothetical protein